ncbi:shikimate kinase [Mucilaginibacter yixingensis]|uniref:Shikimate kinase n=1 Tax=Mucilaginibacter yixingensis TaxID=1295612 RepID=A0A2T5JDR5_9SPHI|nr:shikimate kinase [Mucilaginibacter yixingensis]PTQ99785.1 shikimate kinase [Mucilaginibacter yixingensis]
MTNANAPDASAHRIFLIGYMGCGKTTWGKKLAARLNYAFVDLDTILEEKEGMTIPEYFTTHGEAAFRNLESAILKSGDYPQRAVISTGGGLPCFFDNLEWMNANGQTIYMNLPPAVLASRLDNGKDERPIIRGKHGDELIAFIEEKLAEREGFYTQAQHTINGINMSVERLMDELGIEHPEENV